MLSHMRVNEVRVLILVCVVCQSETELHCGHKCKLQDDDSEFPVVFHHSFESVSC